MRECKKQTFEFLLFLYLFGFNKLFSSLSASLNSFFHLDLRRRSQTKTFQQFQRKRMTINGINNKSLLGDFKNEEIGNSEAAFSTVWKRLFAST
jgi:hypothetical protein